MSPQFRTWAAITGTAAVATLGLLVPTAAGAAQIHTTPLRTLASTSVQPHGSTSSARGGSQLGGQRIRSDKATQVHMQFTNKTGQTLNLTDSSRSGEDAHWETQPPTTLAPGATGDASAYSAGDAQIDLTYTGASDNAVFKLQGITPLIGDNSASGSSSSASYRVAANAGSGYNPTDTYTIQPGGIFHYTGQTTTYTVPVGVTQLKLEAIGGGTDNTARNRGTAGADVTGVLAVTPGEQLTIGTGGQGGADGPAGPDAYAGGWGMTVNGDNYSGGNTNDGGHDIGSNPGGGATVVFDSSSGSIIVVAGGGGGDGAVSTDCDAGHIGGDAGAGGSWTGGNGNPWPGGGGQAGANTTTQGQPSTTADDCQGGAGGGGVKGGLAGVDGGGAGGGAGSSAAPGLTGASVTANIPRGGNAGGSGEVIISAAS
jgi:hypothetical protein